MIDNSSGAGTPGVLRVCTGINNRNGVQYWTDFTITDSVPEIGEQFAGRKIRSVAPAIVFNCANELLAQYKFYNIELGPGSDDEYDGDEISVAVFASNK